MSASGSEDILRKRKDNTSFESFMELCNAPLFTPTELFPRGALEGVEEKSKWVLHDEGIGKATMMYKKQEKSMKRLKVSHLAHGRQSFNCPDIQSSRTSSGKCSLSAGCKNSSSFSKKEQKFSCLPLSCRWEVFCCGTGVH